MTSVKVVDASAIAAIVFGEPEAEAVVATLGQAKLMAPALLEFELANVCSSLIRKNPHEAKRLSRSFALRARLGIQQMDVDHDAVVALAARARLTAYDASYLWLAHRLGAEVVTLDARLARAATQSVTP